MAEEHVELANRCLAGDARALGEFVELFQHRVFALCMKMLGQRQDAEDTAQESLLRAVRYLKNWDSSQPLAPWVLKIAANRCRTALSRRASRPVASPYLHDSPDHTPAAEPGLAEELQRALEILNDNHRTCFVLFYQQELSVAEVADIMEIPEGTVKTWLHRSRKQLAERLTERGLAPRSGTDR